MTHNLSLRFVVGNGIYCVIMTIVIGVSHLRVAVIQSRVAYGAVRWRRWLGASWRGEFVQIDGRGRGDVELVSCAPRFEIRRDERSRNVKSGRSEAWRCEENRDERIETIDTERVEANRYERYGANRAAGGEVAKGIYEKQPVGLCDTYVRSCPLTVTSPILYQMGSRAGRRREPLESIAEARIDNVSIEKSVSNRNIFYRSNSKQRMPISKRNECEIFG